MKSPCLGCEERKYKCHSVCDSYKEFQKECERVRIVRRKEIDKRNVEYIGKRKIWYWQTNKNMVILIHQTGVVFR